MAIGSSVNVLARLLLSDDLTDDEEVWRRDQQCSPPFVLVHIGPTKEQAMAGEFLKLDDAAVHTYDSFNCARIELCEMEGVVLPSVISALTCSLNFSQKHLKLKKLTRDVFGIMPSGGLLHDFRIQVSGTAYASHKVGLAEVSGKLKGAKELAAAISPKVSRFFHLALEETDLLKRFLYFFLAIERQTHITHASVDHDKHLLELVQSPDRIRDSSVEFFQSQRERWTSLKDRFVWCALTVWTHLSDEDLAAFTRLKKIRDEIAHGAIPVPPESAVVEVEQLAIKLQQA